MEPISATWPDASIADAYAIQQASRATRIAGGERLVGRKVGLTNVAMQTLLGVDEPDFGYLLDAMLIPSGSSIESSTLLLPRVEPEVGFVMARELAGVEVTAQDVLAATEAFQPVLEIVDSRVRDWRITIIDTVADNASSALVVTGERFPADAIELGTLEVEMRVGDTVESGRGDAVLGHPAEAVAWLVRMLASFDEGLSAGDLVIPGAFARAISANAGDVVVGDFGPLGRVEADFR